MDLNGFEKLYIQVKFYRNEILSEILAQQVGSHVTQGRFSLLEPGPELDPREGGVSVREEVAVLGGRVQGPVRYHRNLVPLQQHRHHLK